MREGEWKRKGANKKGDGTKVTEDKSRGREGRAGEREWEGNGRQGMEGRGREW